jgi:hypothetical protein
MREVISDEALYYEDDSEGFEVSAALIEQLIAVAPRWHARAEWKTRKQIRG